MKSLLLVVDPMPTCHSVQYELFRSMLPYFLKNFRVTMASVFIGDDKKKNLAKLGVQILSTGREATHLERFFAIFDNYNESMFWLESWLREGLFGQNSREFEALINKNHYDYVVNATNTFPVGADIWWIQGPPLLPTLEGMANDNRLAKLGSTFGKNTIMALDHRLIEGAARRSRRIIANSNHSSEIYSLLGIKVDGVVLSVKSLDNFKPPTTKPSKDYVLAYIGKEIELEPIIDIAKRGVKVIGFGSKLPLGFRTDVLKKCIDFRGKVTDQQLLGLYSNALFTLFPFTHEALGYVPLESMACGTPVLTYGREGPAETVLDGVTGWLVENNEELVQKAFAIWSERNTGLNSNDCVERASKFGPDASAQKIVNLLYGSV